MAIRDEPWPQGTPCWVDAVVPDLDAAADFYTGLLGWTTSRVRADRGAYATCALDGRSVAGLGEPSPGQQTDARWITYLAVDDLDAATERVGPAGGHVLAPPTDVEGFARIALVLDPGGALVGLWQAAGWPGAELVDVHGTQVWNEVTTPDLAAGLAFYAEVVGLTGEELAGSPAPYATLHADGVMVAGIAGVAPGAEPSWRTYVAVDDPDATAARAVELGGSVVEPVRDSPFGRIAVLAGPGGEVFSVITTPADPRADEGAAT